MHGWLGWLAVFPMTEFACPCLMASVDMAPGEWGGGGRESRHCWNGRVDSTGWQSGQTKSAFSFHQCNFWLLCDCPPACQAERIASWGEGWKRSDSESKWPGSVSDVCIHWHTRQTGVGTRLRLRVGRPLIKKTERKKKTWCNKSCQWRINTFMRQWDERKWVILGYDQCETRMFWQLWKFSSFAHNFILKLFPFKPHIC